MLTKSGEKLGFQTGEITVQNRQELGRFIFIT